DDHGDVRSGRRPARARRRLAPVPVGTDPRPLLAARGAPLRPRRLLELVLLCALALSLTACGRPFKIKTAPGLVELDEKDDSPYAYRAIAPDGVVVAVRVIDTDDRGDLDTWTHAVVLRMQQVNGYALLGTSDVKSRDGTPGKELHFGHDEGPGRKPF